MIVYKRKYKREMKAYSIVQKSDLKSRKRAKYINVKFERCEDGEAYFSVPSNSYRGKVHIVLITSPQIKKDITLSQLKGIVHHDDIKIACSCEAFLYQGYKYFSYISGAGVDKETRKPKSYKSGLACKHIIAVLDELI